MSQAFDPPGEGPTFREDAVIDMGDHEVQPV
jgi:hypothetical protein